ncbi:MAG: folylpolyglutamate synthase/dihydrofolate synthase family protein [Maribacter sp.]
MTYQEILDWMYAQLPMYQNKGAKAFHAKLDGIKALSAHLEHPHHHFKSIHVAGTNGKGSSSHMLASVLQEAGYKVGLYTSPHLKDFRERIRINGKVVSEKFVTDFIAANQSFLESNQLSFFEMTVGMAFSFFAERKVDIAVVETGLGGRLDSTNIIIPEVSLITNIGLDHMDMLGDTLEKIAFEKAGIIKKGIPVVISEYQAETAPVFEEVSDKLQARIIYADAVNYPEYAIDLLGNYQKKNIKGVLAVINELKQFEVSEVNLRNGLLKVVQNTGLLGRWQEIGSLPTIICDTAHNKEGLSIVLNQIRQSAYEKLHIVLGFVKEKDLVAILPLFPKDAIYYFCCPKINRGLDEKKLKEVAREYGLIGMDYSSVNKAFKEAKGSASPEDFIYVGGSTFVVAEVL